MSAMSFKHATIESEYKTKYFLSHSNKLEIFIEKKSSKNEKNLTMTETSVVQLLRV